MADIQGTDIRVGIVTENHFPRLGGMELCNHYLAMALNRQAGVRAMVACSTLPEVPRDFAYPYPIFRSRSLSVLTGYLRRRNVATMIDRERLNILHGSMLHGGGAAALAAGGVCGIPVVVQSHGADVQTVPEIGYGLGSVPAIARLAGMVVAAADRVIAVSSLNREMLVSLGASSARVEIVPNGAAIEEIEAIPVENLRTELGIADDAFVIMTVGRNSPIKRMELLYEAIARVRTRIPRMWCISVGPVKDLRALAERFGIADMVVLTGAVPEKGIASEGPPFPRLVNLYRSADLFVSVSFLEAFNMSALDALACGTPVLVSEKQGIRDLIREGDTGSVLYDETPEALGERLVMLSATAAVMRANRKAVQRSVAHCTWDVAARRLAEIYREVLAERNPIRRVV